MDFNQEKEFIKTAQNNPEALKTLYEKFYPPIYGYILKRTVNVQIAEDITSEVFFKVFKNLWKFKFRNISISSWIYKIATHEIANFYAKKSNKFFSLDNLLQNKKFEPKCEETPKSELLKAEEALQSQKTFVALQEKMNSLPFKYQTVLVLRYFENKKIKEIAEIMSKKEASVKTLLKRGVERLQNICLFDKNFETFLNNSGLKKHKSINRLMQLDPKTYEE